MMKKQTILAFALTAAAALQASAATPLGVATTGSGELLSDTSRVIDLDEVVVVSQPKETVRLRRQPLSSTMFGEKQLRNINADQLSTLSLYAPSFVVPQYGSRYTSSMYVRGIGSRSGDPSTGIYYDNIPLVSKSTYNRHFYQLDRVDLLRGPQGTLYGVNAEAGLVKMYSRNPLNYQGLDVRLDIGTGLYSNAEIAKYHRPSDKLAFSVSGFYSGLGGFWDNTNLNKKADRSNEAGSRLRLIWLPTPLLTIDLTSDYQYTNQNAFAYGEYDNAGGNWADPSTTTMNGYKRQMVTTGLNIRYKLPSMLFTSTTSHQYLYDLMEMDQDYLPADYLHLSQHQKMNAITQEFAFRSRSRSRWQHSTGLFFSHQWLHTNAPVTFGSDMNKMIVSQMGMPPAIAQFITIDDNRVPGDFKTPQTDAGLFHESNVFIGDGLMITLGLRYDHQKVSIDYDSQARFLLNFNGTMGGHPVSSSHSFTSSLVNSVSNEFDQLLPKFAITHNFRNGNVYATVSKGFRAGGYNLQMFSDIFKKEQATLGKQLMQLAQKDMDVAHSAEDYEKVNNTITYEPETSWNYEAGTHLNLFGRSVTADAAVFYTRISNQQLSVMAGNYGYGRMMINAGRSASCGAELSLRGSAVADHLTWAATYGYTHSTFRSYSETTVANNETTVIDHRGQYVPFVPQHTFSALADYRFDINGSRLLNSVTIGANIAGNGPIYWDVDNAYKQNLYAVLGAHITLDFGKFNVNVWGRNLTDTGYNTFLVNSSVDGTQRSFSQRGCPVQAGLDVSMHF